MKTTTTNTNTNTTWYKVIRSGATTLKVVAKYNSLTNTIVDINGPVVFSRNWTVIPEAIQENFLEVGRVRVINSVDGTGLPSGLWVLEDSKRIES